MLSYFSIRVAYPTFFPIYSMFFVRSPRSFADVSNLSLLDNKATMNIETIMATTTQSSISYRCSCVQKNGFFDFHDGYSLATERNFRRSSDIISPMDEGTLAFRQPTWSKSQRTSLESPFQRSEKSKHGGKNRIMNFHYFQADTKLTFEENFILCTLLCGPFFS